MIFSYHVTVFDDFKFEDTEACGIVSAENYGDAANKVEEYFGKDDLEKVTIKAIAGSDIVKCEEGLLKWLEQEAMCENLD